MEHGDTGMLTVQPANSRVDTRVDGDVVSRFATCCRALGIVVYQRQRPADLAAARSGFAALTRIAHDQCDAWTGLAAAGDTSLRVLEAVSRTAASAGVLQRQVDLAPNSLGFRYDTGLYLQFRATTPDDFHLAYAAALATAGRFADADAIVAGLTAERPNWREARWVSVVINYRAERDLGRVRERLVQVRVVDDRGQQFDDVRPALGAVVDDDGHPAGLTPVRSLGRQAGDDRVGVSKPSRRRERGRVGKVEVVGSGRAEL